MKNTDFMNLSLPEGADKIDVEILNNDFKKLENEASKHYIQQLIEVDGTATIIGSIGPYVQLENLTDNILNVSIGDELVVLMKGDNRKIRTVSGENYGVVTSGAVRITYYINAQTYADENFYKKEKVDELLSNVEATVEVDAELSEVSENPVQNKVITAELANYASTANTAIQKNADDIKSAKNSNAINKTTLGVQCKNLFKLKQNAGYTQTISGVSYTFNDDGSITASGTLTGEAALNFSEIYLETGTYRISSSKIFNVQIYKSNSYVGSYQATPEGKVITISEAGIYSFRWYWGAAGAVVNSTIYPMLTYADVSDLNFKPYAPNLDARISVLETLSDVVCKNNKSSYCSIDGYILRVGNQVHLNLTATVHTACNAWVGLFLILPFKAKTPDGSTRYTLKQTQADGRETSIYLQNGSTSFFSSTAFQKGDVITISPMILDMYVEEATTTEGGE